MDLEKARLLIFGSQVLGKLINDTDSERQIDELRKELAELKSRIGLRVA